METTLTQIEYVIWIAAYLWVAAFGVSLGLKHRDKVLATRGGVCPWNVYHCRSKGQTLVRFFSFGLSVVAILTVAIGGNQTILLTLTGLGGVSHYMAFR